MDQPPPPYNASMAINASGSAPTNVPSYPGMQNPPQPQQYSTSQMPTSYGYNTASQYSAAPGQSSYPQYPPSNPPVFNNNPYNQPGFVAPSHTIGPQAPPQNTAFAAGQVQIPSQERQFMGAPDLPLPEDGPAPDEQDEAPVPTAPSISQMDKVPGYENISFDGGFLPPPPPDPNARGQQPIRVNFSNFQTMTTEDARESLLVHVGEHCCFGKRAARNMILNNIQNIPAIHYTLETFAERRETLWAFEPYVGQIIDTPANGPAPSPWDITIPMAEPYADKIMLTEVPHTASIKQCHDCGALGMKRCFKCLGCGRVRCHHCHGSGRVFRSNSDRCSWCWGRGQQSCNKCSGTGQIVCPSCKGKMQLKWFIQLKITWKVHFVEYIIERTPMPDELVKAVTGQTVFEEDLPRVWPITNFPDEELNNASAACVQQHNSVQETERVVSQRQKIRIVPVAQVSAMWKGKNDDFYVYGFENKIYWPNYPQQCCWGCNIL